jgi:hypothetical protein
MSDSHHEGNDHMMYVFSKAKNGEKNINENSILIFWKFID